MTDWPTIGPTDGPALVAAVKAASSAGLAYAGRLAGGNAGAVAAHRPDGTPVVLTYWDATAVGRAAVVAVGRLIAVGYPVPDYELVPLAVGAAVVQERVDGVPGARPTPRLVDPAAGREGARAHRPAGCAGRRTVRPAGRPASDRGRPGYCRHGQLREHSAASRELLGWIEDVGRRAPADAGTIRFTNPGTGPTAGAAGARSPGW